MLKRSCLIYINWSFIVQNLNKMHVCCLPKKLIHTETWNKDLLPRSLSTSEVNTQTQRRHVRSPETHLVVRKVTMQCEILHVWLESNTMLQNELSILVKFWPETAWCVYRAISKNLRSFHHPNALYMERGFGGLGKEWMLGTIRKIIKTILVLFQLRQSPSLVYVRHS